MSFKQTSPKISTAKRHHVYQINNGADDLKRIAVVPTTHLTQRKVLPPGDIQHV